MIGAWMAFSSNVHNQELLRSCVLKLQTEEPTTNLKALIAMIWKDTSKEGVLKLLMKKLHMNPKLGMNMLQIIDRKNTGDPYRAAFKICEDYCSNPEIVSSIVAQCKGDISNFKVIWRTLDIPIENTSLLMFWAAKKREIPFGRLARKLNIQNRKGMEIIIKLAWKDITVLKDLKHNNKKIFTDEKYELLEAVFNIAEETKNRIRYNGVINLKKIYRSCEIISQMLMKNLSSSQCSNKGPSKDFRNYSTSKTLNSNKFSKKSSEGDDTNRGSVNIPKEGKSNSK